ncbi:N(4)-acetylcytidine aminohydrolase [Shewanella insulae]|uniref:N(4)-acetylcytidine aminohydrolase n=1 Tax=Shewanella insulae TaxID=2681496 RepID=UPI001EFEB8B6|nr:N(4)-acetylcytidine aminohydrolase [Shewanella insulae]MCG9755069.1 N(4)-acetylcytidine aminohydrolase [Shewanella insulae]
MSRISCDAKITFFERFEADILSGAKTITLRDESESHFRVGDRLSVSTFETGRYFCDIQVVRVEAVAFEALNSRHAEQENMSLEQLKTVITEIYGEIETLYLIEYRLL